MDGFKKLGPEDENPFESREWWNDEDKAREAAGEFGMTPKQMGEAGMHPDGTPYDSGPASEDPTQDKEEPTQDKENPTPDKKKPTPEKEEPTPEKENPTPEKENPTSDEEAFADAVNAITNIGIEQGQ